MDEFPYAHDAYIVAGPESSGTKFVHRLLIEAGARKLADPPSAKPVALHRSWPHGMRYPSFQEELGHISATSPFVVVTVRDFFATGHSQVAAGHVPNWISAEENIQRAYTNIFAQIASLRLPFVVSSYEALAREDYQRKLTGRIGLSPVSLEFKDGNSRYYA